MNDLQIGQKIESWRQWIQDVMSFNDCARVEGELQLITEDMQKFIDNNGSEAR
jgi:hypothetical protein